jgi:hypothetical protein
MVEVIDAQGNKITLLVASFRADPDQVHAILTYKAGLLRGSAGL